MRGIPPGHPLPLGGASPWALPARLPSARRRADRGAMLVKQQAVEPGVKLLVVQGRPQGKSLLFPPGEYLFGRGAECQIQANSDWVSRQHCLLRVTEEGAFIRDLGSRNGTLVNGSRVRGERRLAVGHLVHVRPL